MSTKLILIQGNRPGAGKDTVAKMVLDELRIQHCSPRTAHAKLSWPLKALVHDLFDVAVDHMQEPVVEDKEKYRADYIAVSESLKQVHGEAFWASIFMEQFKMHVGQFKYTSRNPEYVVVSDSGFIGEASFLAQQFGFDNTVMLRVIRLTDGPVTPDSRKLFSIAKLGVREIDIYNDTTIEDLQKRVSAVVRML